MEIRDQKSNRSKADCTRNQRKNSKGTQRSLFKQPVNFWIREAELTQDT